MQSIGMRRSGARDEQHDLLFALGVSVAVHLFLIAFVMGVVLLRDPELLKQIAQSPEKFIELTAKSLEEPVLTSPPPQLQTPQEMPMLFIEVDPSMAVSEPSEKSKYYAAQNTLAANPDTRFDTDQPKIEGTQTQIIRAFEAPRSQPKPMPLQPSPAQAKVEAQPQKKAPTAEQQAARNQQAQKKSLLEQARQERGDLEELRPAQKAQEQKQATEETVPRQRPKTVAMAKAQKGDARPPGERMKQDGGVKRADLDSSLTANSTPLGQYDAQIIDAIRTKWYALLEDSKHARDRKGVVVIEFRIYSNGTVRDVRTADEDVGEFLAYLCQSAIISPAPYLKWPAEVRAAVGKDYRDVRFTFFYN